MNASETDRDQRKNDKSIPRGGGLNFTYYFELTVPLIAGLFLFSRQLNKGTTTQPRNLIAWGPLFIQTRKHPCFLGREQA